MVAWQEKTEVGRMRKEDEESFQRGQQMRGNMQNIAWAVSIMLLCRE